MAAATNTVLLAATARVVSIERATGHRQDATAWLRASHEIDAARIALMDDSLPASAAEQLWRTAVDAVAKARAGEHASPDIRVVQQAQKQYQAGGKLYGNVVLVNTDRVDAWRGENVDGRSPDQPLVTGR